MLFLQTRFQRFWSAQSKISLGFSDLFISMHTIIVVIGVDKNIKITADILRGCFKSMCLYTCTLDNHVRMCLSGCL